MTRDIAGVRRDVRQLVKVEPNVERVEDRARARHPEVRLEMTKVVPAERRHAVTASDAEPLQRGREPTRTT